MKRIFVIIALLIGFAFNNVNAQDSKSKSTKTEQKSTDKKLKKMEKMEKSRKICRKNRTWIRQIGPG